MERRTLRKCWFSSVQFSRSAVADSVTPWTAARHASLSINFRSLLKLMSIALVMPSNHLILCHPLLLLPSIFPLYPWRNCIFGGVCMLSCVRLFAIPWTAARQAPLFMGFFQARILEWLPFPPPGDLLHPGIKPESPALQALSLSIDLPGKPT